MEMTFPVHLFQFKYLGLAAKADDKVMDVGNALFWTHAYAGAGRFLILSKCAS